MTTIEENVRAREASNTLIELGISLAMDEGLEPDQVRHFWRCVMETAAELIGEPPCELDKKPNPLLHTYPSWDTPADDDDFPFGRYHDVPYGEVPGSYYKWLAKQSWLEAWPDVLAYIQENDLD